MNSFLARGETLWCPLLHAGILVGLSLCRYCVCVLTVSVGFICALVPLSQDDAVSLKLSTTSGSNNFFFHSHRDP